MLTLLEVRKLVDQIEPGEATTIELARLDLTENTEAERQEALDNARVLYGADCAYYWHSCGHDEQKPCTVTEAH